MSQRQYVRGQYGAAQAEGSSSAPGGNGGNSALGSRMAAGREQQRREMQRVPTTNSYVHSPAAQQAAHQLAAQQRAQTARQATTGGARVGASTARSPSPQQAGEERNFQGRTRETMHARRPSQVVVQSERKTEYWRDLLTSMEQAGNFKFDATSANDVIARALALGLVQDKKAREAQGLSDTPDPKPILDGLEKAMYARLTELNNNQPVRLDQSKPQLEKIIRMEKAIQVLEARRAKEEAEEAEKVKAKIGELQSSLQTITVQKEQQREQNRRTMKLELDNLRESMAKMAQEQQRTPQADPAVAAMEAKMKRLEAALRLMNQERKEQVEDKDTLLLKRKLALFEQKFKELEAQKTVQAAESDADALRDKLLMMEDKLAKMERRKSVSISTMMQEKMNGVERQLEMLRNQRGGGGGSSNPAVEQKMAALEAELKKLQSTKITPAMVNDDETNALRAHVKKLEEAMLAAEKKMELQRKKVEEERLRAAEERRREEQEFREASRRREQELLKRLQMMEQKMSQSTGGDPALAQRMQRLEQNIAQGRSGGGMDPAMAEKLAEMERKLQETQRALEEERHTTKAFLNMAPQEGPALESWQSQMQIQWLQETNKKLMEKLENATKAMDEKMAALSKMSFAPGMVHKSGLSYAEINAKLAEIQTQLFDPNTDERTQEQLNIEYEKLITELESTDEYKKEQQEIREKWKRENEPLNNQALLDVRKGMRAMGDAGVLELLKTKPELKLVLRTPDQIIKLHERDFMSLTTQNLTLQEARALYAAMPQFRREQEKQLQWVDSLKNKIETEMSKPARPPPPPIKATKKVKLPKAPKGKAGGGGGDFLAELLAKRARKE